MNKIQSIAIFTFILTAVFSSAADAQIAGGGYTIQQSVIASGGSSSESASGSFKIQGVIGQPIAGATDANLPFTVQSGFFTPDALAPTAAGVNISGRIRTATGRGIRSVRVTLTTADGLTFSTVSGLSGAYNFDDVSPGQTVILTVIAIRFTFSQPTQVLSLSEEITDFDFIGSERSLGLDDNF